MEDLAAVKGKSVALLAEGVDRNLRDRYFPTNDASVALLAEGVDRNNSSYSASRAALMSPSSRRAWIEIRFSYHRRTGRPVALLAEGVDRNIKTEAGAGDNPCRPPRGGRG